ncbi:hypothetical protein ACFV2N_37570 [Streptomyces sp. NPDC059680]|uniref:hypothetical protein n=1 Tax=Streptomyces sp. NPDC059680 TaxID=3346904 RepID=UPI0036B33821
MSRTPDVLAGAPAQLTFLAAAMTSTAVGSVPVTAGAIPVAGPCYEGVAAQAPYGPWPPPPAALTFGRS